MSNHYATDPKIVVLLDVTTEMKLGTAKPAVLGFLNLLQPDNRFAVRSYADQVYRTFPDEGLETYDDREVIDDACLAVEGTFPRSDKCDMAAAILAGKSLLRREADPRSMVMISGSPWDVGVDPLRVLPSDVPIYTIGFHDQGQLATLEQIAQQTGGQYAFADDPRNLFTETSELVESLGLAIILAQGTRTLENDKAFGITGRVADGAELATVMVYWENPNVIYATNGSAQSQRSVEVTLTEPGGTVWEGEPAYVGPGFACFAIADPAAGSWVADTTYHGRGNVTVFASMYQPAS